MSSLRIAVLILLGSVSMLSTTSRGGEPAQGAAPSRDRVQTALDRGADWLLRRQDEFGGWPEFNGPYHGASTGLAYLALRACGLYRDRTEVRRAAARATALYDEARQPGWRSTHLIALRLIVLAEQSRRVVPVMTDPQTAALTWTTTYSPDDGCADLARELADGLTEIQGRNGAWGYGRGDDRPSPTYWDNSNTHLAIVGLHAATQLGVEVPEEVFRRALSHFLAAQQPTNAGGSRSDPDGRPLGRGWSYRSANPEYEAEREGQRTSLSMTTCAMTAVSICLTHLSLPTDETLRGRADAALRDAVTWMSDRNRWSFGRPGDPYTTWTTYYAFYALERADAQAGLSRYGEQDWFDAVSTHLVAAQRDDGSWPGFGHDVTIQCLALLALSHARAAPAVAVTPSTSLGEAHFEAARGLDDSGIATFVRLVLARWTDASSSTRKQLAAGLATVGERVLPPMIAALGGAKSSAAAADALARTVDGGPTPRADSAALRVAWTEWLSRHARLLSHDAERHVLTATGVHPDDGR